MTDDGSQQTLVLECPQCGFVFKAELTLPAWCPLCDEDRPSELKLIEVPQKTSEEAA